MTSKHHLIQNKDKTKDVIGDQMTSVPSVLKLIRINRNITNYENVNNNLSVWDVGEGEGRACDKEAENLCPFTATSRIFFF